MTRRINIEINGADLVLVMLCIVLACMASLWWLIPVAVLVMSWVWCPRWSRKDGWRFWR